MTTKTLGLPDSLVQYMREHTVAETPALEACRMATAELAEARMQISPEQGQLLAFLVKLTGAKQVLEIGVFTGYSSVAMAQALPADGNLTACDVSAEFTSKASDYWRQAGVEDKVKLVLGDANDTLQAMLKQGHNQFDFAFIDADKESEVYYLQACQQLVKPAGLILIDNAFWSGKVADPSSTDAATNAIRQVINDVFSAGHQPATLVPIADGLIMIINEK